MAPAHHMNVMCSGNSKGRIVLCSDESRRTRSRSRCLSLACLWAWHTWPLASDIVNALALCPSCPCR